MKKAVKSTAVMTLKNSSNTKELIITMTNPDEDNIIDCKNCTEWEYFEGYGYGCFVRKTMIPLDATKCEFFSNKNKYKKIYKPQKDNL